MIKKNLTHWLSVIVIGITLGFALQFVRAWTEPTTAPPGGNVGAPINTGSQTQAKTGSLNIYGVGSDHGIWATGSSYAVGGQSAIAGIWGVLGYGGWGGYFSGPAGSSAYMQAPTFYDTDSRYYLDANSASQLNRVDIKNDGEPTLYFHRPGVFATGIKLRGDKLWFGGWSTGDGTAGIVAGKMYDGNDTRYIVDPNGTSRLNYTVTDNIYNYGGIYSGNYIQSPYFSDANDTRYYLDPNGTSRLNYPVTDNILNYGGILVGASTAGGNKGAGTINADQVCIRGVCQTTWPTGGTTQTPYTSPACECALNPAAEVLVWYACGERVVTGYSFVGYESGGTIPCYSTCVNRDIWMPEPCGW